MPVLKFVHKSVAGWLVRENADLDTAVNRWMPQPERNCIKWGPYAVNTTMGPAVDRLNDIYRLKNRYAPGRNGIPVRQSTFKTWLR